MANIITGDLMVVENVKLRELVSKVPDTKSQTISIEVLQRKMLFESIDLYAERWAKWEQAKGNTE